MSILIKNPKFLVTLDNQRNVLKNASVYIEDNVIKQIITDGKPPKADRIIDAKGKTVLPGLINTHHHLFQTLFRGFDKLKRQKIDKWIKTMVELSTSLDYKAAYTGGLTGMVELILSGCTTTSDHLYVYPDNRNELIDATIQAATDIGIRFHPVRGFIEKELSDMGQEPDIILNECGRVARKYHDSSEYSMLRVSVGPVGCMGTTPETI